MSWLDKARKALAAGHVLIMVGLCIIEYEGRAVSKLGEGERIVIIKKDRSILVHRPIGHEPVNWQPHRSKIELIEENGRRIIKASRANELLKIVFLNEPETYAFQLSDDAEFEMYASEVEMKEAVLLQPDLIEEGFTPLTDERKVGRTGRVDIFGVDRNGCMTVVELKRRTATTNDVKQLQQYVEELSREFGKKPRAILAAPSATKSAITFLKTAKIEFRCLTPKTCSKIIRRRNGLDAHL